MSAATEKAKTDRPLELGAFMRDLEKAGRITKDQLDTVASRRRTPAQQKAHILAFIAEQNLDDQSNPGQKLNLESLTRFLAESCNQEYFHIDPLSIDAAKVTQAMSYAFTQRHKIMAVAVSSDEIIIASAEPNVSSWAADLEHVLRKPIKRVVANPVELQRITEELYLPRLVSPTWSRCWNWER